MSKYGKKFTCWSCSAKFYDLNKPSPKCPKCGANPEDDPNKGVPAAAAPGFTEDYADDFEEEVDEEIATTGDEEEVEEDLEEAAPPGEDY